MESIKSPFEVSQGDQRVAMSDHIFFEVYEAHASQVRKILGRLVSWNELDDLVQDTFIKVFQSIHDFNNDAELSTWIYRIAINTARDHQRKQSRWKNLVEKWLSGLVTHEQQDLDQKVDLVGALARLKFQDRTIAVLFLGEGYSLNEISEMMGIPVGTVKSRIHNIRKKLKYHLQEGS